MPFSSTTLNRCKNGVTAASAALNCSPRKYGPLLCLTRSSRRIETPEYWELSPDLYNGAGLLTFKDGLATIVSVSPEERIPLVHEFIGEGIDEETDLRPLNWMVRVQVGGWEEVGNEF